VCGLGYFAMKIDEDLVTWPFCLIFFVDLSHDSHVIF
jgi:hypothetical protein